jgi:hypothetical protein
MAVYGPVRHPKIFIWTEPCHMAVYGQVRHQKNIIWTEAFDVHIIFFLLTARALYLTRQHYRKTILEGEGNNIFST